MGFDFISYIRHRSAKWLRLLVQVQCYNNKPNFSHRVTTAFRKQYASYVGHQNGLEIKVCLDENKIYDLQC